MPVLAPRLDKLIVKPIEKPKTSPGGIALPDNARDDNLKAGRGTVIACGPGKLEWTEQQKADNRINPGTIVHFSLYEANEIQFNGEKFYALNLEHILATES